LFPNKTFSKPKRPLGLVPVRTVRVIFNGTKSVLASFVAIDEKRRTLMKLSKAIWASAVISVMTTAALAQQATGTVTKVDEQKGTISIELTQGGTVGANGAVQEFKAQDGLLFNELRPGDKVLFRVFESNGTKTITKLNKE
jgi:Cu/Ag efflux protein CusF